MLSGCKKEYVCICSNSTIDTGGFIIKNTKRKAEKECNEYKTNGKLNYTPDNCEIH